MLSLPSLPQGSSWDFRALAGELPDGLPVGALSVVRLPNQSVRRGPWSTVVGQLLLDTLDRCRAAVYIRAGERYPVWPEAGVNPLGPHYRGVGDACGCCPAQRGHGTARRDGSSPIGPFGSTLDNLAAALPDHEPWHGPSLVMIDNLGSARPYADLSAALDDYSAQRDSARRCAKDLLTFAASHPVAPTVVVATDPCPVLDNALAEVARVVITALPCERHRPVTVHVQDRGDLSAAWPAATEVVLPWFDWGFDERDLDAEDAQSDDEGWSAAAGDPIPEPWAESAAASGGTL